ncbi:hypothetical protein EU811_21350 [Arthrobacter sp. TS-15]|nr:hypothetical protein EU811_21350 [Arthrobacter sp. TS-15]
MTVYKHEDWTRLINTPVEIRQYGQTIRTGIVDSAMPDSSRSGSQPRPSTRDKYMKLRSAMKSESYPTSYQAVPPTA